VQHIIKAQSDFIIRFRMFVLPPFFKKAQVDAYRLAPLSGKADAGLSAFFDEYRGLRFSLRESTSFELYVINPRVG